MVARLGFRHLLLTRFNIRVPEWRDVDKAGVPTLTPEWMDHRWELFERFTVPAVIAQTNQNFTWIVMFDRETDNIKDGPYLPLLVGDDWLGDLQSYIQKPGWLVTTRLDNDDSISPKFIETIQKHVTLKQFHFINLTNGYTLNGHALRPKHQIANPFITLVERGEDAKSVLFTPHTRAMQLRWPVVQVSEGRLWTQIIHERNYVNG